MWRYKAKTILISIAVVLLVVSAASVALKQVDVTATPEQRTPIQTNKLILRGENMDVFSKPYEENKEFKARIAPFFWVEFEGSFSLCLNASERYRRELFASRSKEGFRGNGDDWASLASVFLEEKTPELKGAIQFDPETGMFCAYSSDADALAKFAIAFKEACEDDALIQDLFSRTETEHIFDEEAMKKAYESLIEKGLLLPEK